MKSTYKLINNYQCVVDNGRNLAVLMDLPEGKGDNTAPTALEFLVMSLTGCIGTIYNLVARKMRLTIEDLIVNLDAEKGPEDPTVKAVKAEVLVKSNDSEKKLQKCLETTMKTCPVGVLYEQAGVAIDVSLKVVQ